jgi:hypothetical protein
VKAILAVAIAICATLTSASADAGGPPKSPNTRTSRTFVLGGGPARRVFTMRQPQGVVRLTRLTTTYGIKASVAATIPGVAGVRVINYGTLGNPSPCRRRGSFEVCTQSQEGCPMPRAVWRIHLLKAGGPAGVVRFDFVVGPPLRP